MIIKPRLIRIEGRLQLCMVTYEDGNIVDLNGPVQCSSDIDATKEEFVKGLDEMLGESVHGSHVLEMTDLPDDIQQGIKDGLEAQSSSSESSK
jgi:hypothetical protein